MLVAEVLRHLVRKGLRFDALLLRGLLDLLAVLINAGQEQHVTLEAGLMPGKKIGQHLLIRVPEMGRTIDVIDRGGEEIASGHTIS